VLLAHGCVLPGRCGAGRQPQKPQALA
jgi:hypothetical protein